MNCVIEICAIAPDHNKKSDKWIAGDLVAVKGIKPSFAKMNKDGLYIPVSLIMTRRSRYIFIKSAPDIGIVKFNSVISHEQMHIVQQDRMISRREWNLKLTSSELGILINDGFLNFKFDDFITKTKHKRLLRSLLLSDLNGTA